MAGHIQVTSIIALLSDSAMNVRSMYFVHFTMQMSTSSVDPHGGQIYAFSPFLSHALWQSWDAPLRSPVRRTALRM